jgi:hypothetical protein
VGSTGVVGKPSSTSTPGAPGSSGTPGSPFVSVNGAGVLRVSGAMVVGVLVAMML